jgi:hypothetical protein
MACSEISHVGNQLWCDDSAMDMFKSSCWKVVDKAGERLMKE